MFLQSHSFMMIADPYTGLNCCMKHHSLFCPVWVNKITFLTCAHFLLRHKYLQHFDTLGQKCNIIIQPSTVILLIFLAELSCNPWYCIHVFYRHINIWHPNTGSVHYCYTKYSSFKWHSVIRYWPSSTPFCTREWPDFIRDHHHRYSICDGTFLAF